MTVKIDNNLNKKTPPFAPKREIYFDGLKGSQKVYTKFIKSQENLSHTRFIQDTATNWLPKVVFTRGVVDFFDMSFLEFLESGIFYFAPAIFGNFFEKTYSKFHSKNTRELIKSNFAKSAKEILESKELQKNGVGKKVLATKAAIILACTVIPAAEYALSFAKNLFTLKVFKKSDFNNIANLNKKQVESKEHQNKVEKSAKKHIRNSAIVSLSGILASLVLAKYGHKSKLLQKASSIILQPGAHIANTFKKAGLKNQKIEKFLKRYITPDFAGRDKNGKLKLSEGQLLLIAGTGLFGYSAAAKDRGRLDQLEVWTRVPIVVLYTAFGGALFNNAFNKFFVKKNKFSDVLKKDESGDVKIPKLDELDGLAQKIAKTRKTDARVEFNRLLKEKAVITAIPYGFSLVFMGFLLAGITRFWTQYRYNHGKADTPQESSARHSVRFQGDTKLALK